MKAKYINIYDTALDKKNSGQSIKIKVKNNKRVKDIETILRLANDGGKKVAWKFTLTDKPESDNY